MPTAQQLTEPGPVGTRRLVRVERPAAEPGPGEVSLKISACAVCRTDLQIIEGDLEPRRLPLVPGHQAVGRVTDRGAGVTDLAVGDRVGVGWLAATCGSCRFCTSDRENLCVAAEFTGWDRAGGYSDMMTARSDFVFPIPGSFSDAAAAPLLCGGVIGYRALRLSGIQPGDKLGLYGFGASASLAIQVAIHWGCEVFVATRSRTEQARALEMGAAWAGSYHDRPPALLDAAVTFAPVGYVAVAALKAAAPGATVAINAIHLDRVPEFPYALLWEERSLRSVANYTRTDAREFLQLAGAIPIVARTDPYPLADAEIALQRLKHGDVRGAAVLTMGQ